MKGRNIALCAMFGFGLNTGLIRAQETRAIVTGVVTDPGGAAVPAARVEVKNLSTNLVTSMETNLSGMYVSPPVNPGRYAVTVSAPSFKTVVRNNIELRVGDRTQLDFQLALGEITQTVDVTSESPLLETSSASQSSVINSELVASLPTYAHDAMELIRSTTGVWADPRSTFGMRPFDNSDGTVRIGGGQASTNEILLDGAPSTYREQTVGGNATAPPPDAVSEIKVFTNMYDAEYGRSGAGAVILSLKSGTNDFHGSAGWYWRNDILNATTFESNAGGGRKATYRMNEPTLQFQGPIRIPKVYDGRNRTFFMYALDIYRNSRPGYTTMVVPTALERQGDFTQSYVTGTSGPVVTIYDPLTTLQTGSTYTRQPFADNRIPASLINPIAQKVMALVLQPNQSGVRRGLPNRLDSPNFDHEPFNSNVFRVDHVINDRHRIYTNAQYNHRSQYNGLGYGLQPYLAAGTPFMSTTFRNWRVNHSIGFNLTSTLSPTLVATMRLTWNRHEQAINQYGFDYDPTNLGYPASLIAQAQSKSMPWLRIAGYTDIGPAWTNGDMLNFSNNWTIGETLSKMVGDHTLKFGADLRLMLNNRSTRRPTFTLNTTAGFTQANPLQAEAKSGDGLASFLLGYPSAVTTDYNSFPAEGQRYYGFFFQDDWRVTRQLTLNLGLRWEYESPISDRFNHINIGFDPTGTTRLGSPDGPLVKGGLLFADSAHRLPYKRDLNNFGPRAGFAYQAGSKLVIRGGYALLFTPTSDIATSTGYSITTSPSISEANAGIVPLMRPGCAPPSCGMLSNPFPEGILQPLGSSLGLLTSAGSAISYIWPERTVPYTHTFSVGVQYQLPWRSVLQVSYNGRRSNALPTSRNLNSVTFEQYMTYGSNLTAASSQVANPYAGRLPGTALNGAKMTLQQSLLPYPQFTSITENGRSIGRENYDGLYIQGEKRMSDGLTVLFNTVFHQGQSYFTYLNPGMPSASSSSGQPSAWTPTSST